MQPNKTLKAYVYNFHHKVALITGGTEGIGLATAQRFAQSNAKLFIVGRNSERGKHAWERLSAITPDAYFWPADVSQPESIGRPGYRCITELLWCDVLQRVAMMYIIQRYLALRYW